MRHQLAILALCGVWLLANGSSVPAQGVLVLKESHLALPRPTHLPIHRPMPIPAPSMSYRIKELLVQARVQEQVAQVQVTQSFVNTGTTQMEVQFLFPLPYDGAIDKLTLLVDGKEYPARLLPAGEARGVYEAIVRSSKDPALLEWVGNGMFQTSVFPVPPGAERKVTLNYKQLLRKDRGLVDFLFPLSTAKYTSQAVEKVEFQLSIDSSVDIKNVYSPTHLIDIQRPDAKHAVVKFTRTNEIPATDFRLFYDTDPGALGASVLTYRPVDSEDGYFLMLASPQVKAEKAERPLKTVIFVVDKSGSMQGKKIEQAKAAVKFVLNNLREGDTFNIVSYDTNVESFRPELERFNDQTRQAAIGYVEGIFNGGGTNIHGALTTALAHLKDNSRPNFVLFLTDGLPTVGEVKEAAIAAGAKSNNKVRARLLTFGVGYDVNSRLLDRLARDNFGASEYVRPDEDIEAHVSKVYSRINSPLLSEVQVRFDFDTPPATISGPAISRQYPGQINDLFEGEQLVIVGRYKASGAAKVTIEGKVGGESHKFEFPGQFTAKSSDQSYSFVEKLWALRRVGEIIDQLDLHGRNEELVKELVELSTKHGILTPYTAFLADETTRLADIRGNTIQATDRLRRLESAEGQTGVAQRASKADFQYANSLSDAPSLLAQQEKAASRLGARPQSSAAPANGAGAGLAPLSAPAPAAASGAVVYRDADDNVKSLNTIRKVGDKTLYQRGQYMITPEVAHLDPEKDAAQFTVIERFTDSYFTLVKANSAGENQLLSQQQPNEQLLIQLRGKNYLIK